MILLYNALSNDEISLVKNELFSFEGLDFGTEEKEFLKAGKYHDVEKVMDTLWEDEQSYFREFHSELLGYPVKAYYSFGKEGFQKGIYEFSCPYEEREECFDKITSLILEEMNFISNTWKSQFVYDNALRISDSKDTVLAIYGYIKQNQYTIAIEVFETAFLENINPSNGLPMEVEASADFMYCIWEENILYYVDKNNNNVTEKWNFYENDVDLIRFSEDSLWAIDRETSELLNYPISDECIIWAYMDPISHGRISYQMLIDIETSDWLRYWEIGLNEQGEIARLIECMLP